MALPSTALPVGTEMKPPAAMMRSNARAIDRKILHDRKRPRAPRLEVELVAILEVRMCSWHTVIAGQRSVGDAVDHESAGAADAFAAIVVERDRLFALFDQLLVENVEHLEERHVRR